ncbi:hypothetical protein [Oscillatoria sp. FACHB-1407]|nr:hypothetical protein [Oscillatoria sp. FACHB-1407]
MQLLFLFTHLELRYWAIAQSSRTSIKPICYLALLNAGMILKY